MLEQPKCWTQALQLVEVHCQGEIGKVIVAGAPKIPGRTMAEKMNHINQVDDRLRRFVTLEPRASVNMSVNLLVPPTRADADAGFIVLQADRAHAMSGSNCICVVTALLETGRIAMTEPETVVKLDTPAGLVTATARCQDGRCLSVSLDNVAAFVEVLDQPLSTPEWGEIRLDIAFGGVYYAIVDVQQVGLRIEPSHARELAVAGIKIKRLLQQQVSVQHPEIEGLDEIAYVMFRHFESDGVIQTCTTLQPGRVDRSPCGTGSSANLAVLFSRGEVRVGDQRTSRSIIGGEFTAQVLAQTSVGGRPAILPRITGQAWIYGMELMRFDDDDPMSKGFALSDTWGPQVDLLRN
ncbi:proline racemase family protein [Variovorax paradoxus]|uniref:proline racemase family protein n=1 Tax=Variovorax paradoxus TaxID=34073 RepID=UPI0007811323|nr:proline racemase family protein [Variovorax paradoxus]